MSQMIIASLGAAVFVLQAVFTVLPSMGMPGGTKGTEPVAIMMSFAVTVPPTSTRPAYTYDV